MEADHYDYFANYKDVNEEEDDQEEVQEQGDRDDNGDDYGDNTVTDNDIKDDYRD